MRRFNKITLPVLSAAVLVLCQSSVKEETLKDAFHDKFLIGVAVNRGQIHQVNEAENRLITEQFNSVTAENDMKWMNIHPKKNEYNFEHADKLVAMAEASNMFVVGH